MASYAFEKLLKKTGLTVYEVIEMDKAEAVRTLPDCNIDNCTEDWHWCTGCECHLDTDNTCMNCN